MITNESCEQAYEVVTHPAYRISQVFTFIISLCAIIVLSNFIFRKLFRSVFHGNLKTLLFSYFAINLLLAITMSISFGYHSIQAFFADSKCSLFINQVLFKYLHLTIIFSLTAPMLFPISISIERSIAISKAQIYEKCPVFIGPFLAVLTICAELVVIYLAYQDETFTDDSINFVLIPTASANSMNDTFRYFIFIDIITFIINCLLFKVTSNLNIRENRRKTLSVRFQMEELLVSNRFTIYIFFVHVLFVGTYLLTVLSIRTLGKQYVFTTYTSYTVARCIFTTMPLFSLVVGFVATYCLKRLNVKNRENLKRTVKISYTGEDGAINHDKAIFSVWNSIGNEK